MDLLEHACDLLENAGMRDLHKHAVIDLRVSNNEIGNSSHALIHYNTVLL